MSETIALEPAEPLMAIPTKSGGSLCLNDLVATFEASVFCKWFENSQPRRFTAAHDIDNNAAETIIGYDAHPVLHGYDLLDSFLKPLLDREQRDQTLFQVSDEDQALLYFVALFHDLGESTHESLTQQGFRVVGDVPTDKKTQQDRDDEAVIRQHLFNQLFSDVDQEFAERADSIIRHKPMEGDELLHSIFEAAHALQMLATADRCANNTSTVSSEVTDEIADSIRKHLIPIIGHFAVFELVRNQLRNADYAAQGLAHKPDSSNAHLHRHCCGT